MLLLVFCLLLASAAIISAARAKTEVVEERLQYAQREIELLKSRNTNSLVSELNKKVQELEAQLRSVGVSVIQRENFEKEWRELVVARDDLQQLRLSGVSAEQLPQLVRVFEIMKENGFDLANVKATDERLKALLEQEKNQEAAKPHEWPPIISLSEAGGYFFQSGSAELAPAFSEKLRGSIADQIAGSLKQYQVDIIEVIGHTDEQPLSRAVSNLDESFLDVVTGKKSISTILPADNAGLGLARAIAVANVLKADENLKNAAILPMSAAQLVLPGDTVTTGQAGNVESRRRIEIRIRRRDGSLTP